MAFCLNRVSWSLRRLLLLLTFSPSFYYINFDYVILLLKCYVLLLLLFKCYFLFSVLITGFR